MEIEQTVIIKSFRDINLNNFVMPIIAVYKNPKDFPDKYVARLFNFKHPTAIAVIGDNLPGIRSKIPGYMVRIDRHEIDDPVIVETWI
jgi:hypothetical protein